MGKAKVKNHKAGGNKSSSKKASNTTKYPSGKPASGTSYSTSCSTLCYPFADILQAKVRGSNKTNRINYIQPLTFRAAKGCNVELEMIVLMSTVNRPDKCVNAVVQLVGNLGLLMTYDYSDKSRLAVFMIDLSAEDIDWPKSGQEIPLRSTPNDMVRRCWSGIISGWYAELSKEQGAESGQWFPINLEVLAEMVFQKKATSD